MEKKNEPMVDIDTSGPEVEVNLEEETKQEEPKETLKVEETEPKQEIEVKEETKEEVKEETEDKKKELEDYSDGVQKRIAKLTKKWREAERQKEAALEWAQKVKVEQESLQTKLKEKKALTITSSQMTRYFINIEQAIKLCIFSLNEMIGGEIFFPKMKSFNVVNLAKAISKSNKPKITYTKPGRGEKLFEELVTENETVC